MNGKMFLTAMALSLPVFSSVLSGAPIIQTGFNDASGINSNPTPNSPYTLGGPLAGNGAGEPGWAGTWQGGAHAVQSSVVLEGDGAAQLNPNNQTFRNLSQHLTLYRSEQYVQMTAGASMTAYSMQLPGTEIYQGAIWQVHSDGTFWVIDGVEDGAAVAPAEFSGFTWTPGVWYKITVDSNMVTRSWDFYVNDVKYNAPDPLGFRGHPLYIDQISYYTGNTGLIYMDALTITPEPSSVLMAGLGIVLVLGASARRRLTSRHVRPCTIRDIVEQVPAACHSTKF
jgi:hypothetical protein